MAKTPLESGKNLIYEEGLHSPPVNLIMKEDIFNFEDLFEGSNENGCSVLPAIMASMMMPKPFGMVWNDENIEEFLTKRGYRIVKRHSKVRDTDYNIAIKEDVDLLPPEDDDSDYGIIEVFSNELQRTILRIIDKLDNNGN